MAGRTGLSNRIDAEFSAAEERLKEFKAGQVQAYQGRQQRLEKFEELLQQLREIWKPPLDALAEKFKEQVDVHPVVERGRRSAVFEFKSVLAHIKLRFGVAPDPDVRNVSFTYDLEIIPILMKFDAHDQIEFPLDSVDTNALGNWFEDRVVDFVKVYLALKENQYYLKDHMVEDPIAKVTFPKYAAAATVEAGGKTLYFIDETTLREYQQKQPQNVQKK